MTDTPPRATVPADTGHTSSPGQPATQSDTPRLRTGRMVALLLCGVLGLLVVALVAPWVIQTLGGGASGSSATPTRIQGLPWQVEAGPDGGSTVFGLHLGQDTLAATQARWPDEVLRLALLRDAQGRLALEGYLENITAGALQGKLVISGEADPARLQAWADRAVKQEPQPSGATLLLLKGEDATEARQVVLGGLVFLPAARLDEAALTGRFGPPAERLAPADGLHYLLYPKLGVVIALDPREKSKPVIQYVAPRHFDRLRAPLLH